MSKFGDLLKLTQPFDEEDDFFPGAKVEEQVQKKTPAPAVSERKSSAAADFEKAFGTRAEAPAPETEEDEEPAAESVGFLSSLGLKKPGNPFRSKAQESQVNVAGFDNQVIVFAPQNFDDAGELVSYLTAQRTVVMTLENIDIELARRLLDFMSGIAYALHGKITPVSAKTYFVTPQNVDVVGAQQTPSFSR